MLDWIDLIWVPVAFLAVERGKKLFTVAFVLSCAFLVRLQVELLRDLGYPRGIFGLMDAPLLTRGMVTYGLFIGLFLCLAFFSKGGDRNVHMAASITILIAAFCVSLIVMVL